jgi:hypothetical protein
MDTMAVPKSVRRLVTIAGVFLLVSLLLSGFNAYVTFAAPLFQQGYSGPTTIGFSGQLADSNGDPVQDGNYDITFRLYSQSTGGTALWTEVHNDVPVADGLYSVQLGSVNPGANPLEPGDFEDQRYLGIQVEGDSEMTPRIPVDAVPWAFNARQATGLQGNDVAPASPEDGDVLTWDNINGEWIPDPITFPDLAAVGSNAVPQGFFGDYRRGAILRYVDADTIEVSAGELMVNGYMRSNTSAVDIDFDDLEQGTSAQPNTTYYVYAVADDAESNFDFIISTSSTTPNGPTNYRLLGWFETNDSESPVEIREGSPQNAVKGAGELQFTTGTYVGNANTPRSIYVGFRPISVFIIRENSGIWTLRVKDMPEGYSCIMASAGSCGDSSERIKTFEADGFTIGNNGYVNSNGYTYYWLAWGY